MFGEGCELFWFVMGVTTAVMAYMLASVAVWLYALGKAKGSA